MRKSRGRLVVGARAVALAVAVGVVASTGIAGMSSASAQPKPADARCAGYTAAEIILGFMGEGVVAKQHPDLALLQGKLVGATPRDVEVFLALASLQEPGFTEKFRADVTSGDPFRVRGGLERLDTMSVALRKEVAKGPHDPGTGSGTLSLATDVAITARMAPDIFVTGHIIYEAEFEEGKSDLTTEKAVVIVTKLLAGK
jgi:hypothetical protein